MGHSRVARSEVANFYTSIIILLIEELGCECYNQKYIIVTPEDSPKTLDEALEKVIIEIKIKIRFRANNS